MTGVVSVAVDSVVGIEALLSRAGAARATGATASNSASSRSHSVFVLRIAMRHEATAQTRHGVLNLIDLAGSEVCTACDDRWLGQAMALNVCPCAIELAAHYKERRQ